jgi:hypothetical protein
MLVYELKVGDRFYMPDFESEAIVYFTLIEDCPSSYTWSDSYWKVKFIGTNFTKSMIFYSEFAKGKSVSSRLFKIKDDNHLLQLVLKHT